MTLLLSCLHATILMALSSIWLNFTSHRALQQRLQSHTAKSAKAFLTVYKGYSHNITCHGCPACILTNATHSTIYLQHSSLTVVLTCLITFVLGEKKTVFVSKRYRWVSKNKFCLSGAGLTCLVNPCPGFISFMCRSATLCTLQIHLVC